MPALYPVKKESVGLGGSRMGVLRKKLKHTVIQKYVFLEIVINVKAGRVN
jgi:hypothetical protein